MILKAPVVKKERLTADKQKQGRLQRPLEMYLWLFFVFVIFLWSVAAFTAFCPAIRLDVLLVALEVGGQTFVTHFVTAQNQVLVLLCDFVGVLFIKRLAAHNKKMESFLADA